MTDANGCSAVNSATVADGAAIAVSIAATNTICSGTNTGSLSAMVNVGQAPFTYSWSNGGTTASIANLTAGNYDLTVTDANGCSVVNSATVNDGNTISCLLYTSPSPRDQRGSRMPSSA